MSAALRAMLVVLRECEDFIADYIRTFGYGPQLLPEGLLGRIRAHTKERARG